MTTRDERDRDVSEESFNVDTPREGDLKNPNSLEMVMDSKGDVDEMGREKIRVNVGGMRKTVQTQGMTDAQFEKFRSHKSVHHGDGDLDIGTLSMQITESLKKDEHIEEQKIIHSELAQTLKKVTGIMACQTVFIFVLLVIVAWAFKDTFISDGKLVDSNGDTIKVGSADFGLDGNGRLVTAGAEDRRLARGLTSTAASDLIGTVQATAQCPGTSRGQDALAVWQMCAGASARLLGTLEDSISRAFESAFSDGNGLASSPSDMLDSGALEADGDANAYPYVAERRHLAMRALSDSASDQDEEDFAVHLVDANPVHSARILQSASSLADIPMAVVDVSDMHTTNELGAAYDNREIMLTMCADTNQWALRSVLSLMYPGATDAELSGWVADEARFAEGGFNCKTWRTTSAGRVALPGEGRCVDDDGFCGTVRGHTVDGVDLACALGAALAGSSDVSACTGSFTLFTVRPLEGSPDKLKLTLSADSVSSRIRQLSVNHVRSLLRHARLQRRLHEDRLLSVASASNRNSMNNGETDRSKQVWTTSLETALAKQKSAPERKLFGKWFGGYGGCAWCYGAALWMCSMGIRAC